MKKLLFIALLFTSFVINAQDTFVRKYTRMITTEKNVENPEVEIDLTVVFNPDGKKQIKLYYDDGRVKTLFQTSPVKEGKTVDDEEYQLINVVDNSDGYTFRLQLFDKLGTLRLLIATGYSIEFYE